VGLVDGVGDAAGVAAGVPDVLSLAGVAFFSEDVELAEDSELLSDEGSEDLAA
jgi:hypothetical protein